MRYLWALYQDVTAAFAAGLSAEGAVDAIPLRSEFQLPWWFPVKGMRDLVKQFQRLNILFVYRELERTRGSVAAQSGVSFALRSPHEELEHTCCGPAGVATRSRRVEDR
jgi:hypothetical protein